MAKILLLLTKSSTLTLAHGRKHASGFWAEEFVVPYERFVEQDFDVNVATIGGVVPTPDHGSLDAQTVGYTRPEESVGTVENDVAHYRAVIDGLPVLKAPMAVEDITRERLAEYAGVYISGGHGAMDDMPHDATLTNLLRWVLEDGKPLAAVCHGHSALLSLRDSEGQWPLRGYRMTAFSHDEELVTDMAGQLPFVLQVELERLGAKYEKAPVIWGSYVVEDRGLLTGQNPYSSAALAEAFIKKIAALV
jgi:putative intracellular protease/amidase